MRRPAKGATTHPALVRPGMGYGRPLRARRDGIAPVDLADQLRSVMRGEALIIDLDGRSSVTSSDSLA